MQEKNEAAYLAQKSTSALQSAAKQSLGISEKPVPAETSAKPPSEKPAAASKPPSEKPASNGAAAKAPPSEKASNGGSKTDAQKLDKFISK